MKYRIEIWRFGRLADTLTSDSKKSLVTLFEQKWGNAIDSCEYGYVIYKGQNQLQPEAAVEFIKKHRA